LLACDWGLRKPQLSMLEQMRLDWARSIVSDIEGIKKEDLEVLAKEYLGAGKATLVTVVPEK
jgi:zinc protease